MHVYNLGMEDGIIEVGMGWVGQLEIKTFF